MLLSLGVISIITVIGLCYRMRILDDETVPYARTPTVLTYFVWLFKEIVKANVEVLSAVMSPELEVSPTIVKVPSTQKTGMGKTMFANSITLTPGTVSVELEDGEILVHALLEHMCDDESFADMGQRSAHAVGENVKRSLT